MNRELQVFVSSVQMELEDERLIVQNLLNTDSFLSAHCVPVLYEFEPASPEKALEGCLKSLDRCQVYLLIVAIQYGSLVGDISIPMPSIVAPKKTSCRFSPSSKGTEVLSASLAPMAC
jgi:ATP-dependent DNA helicase RecG